MRSCRGRNGPILFELGGCPCGATESNRPEGSKHLDHAARDVFRDEEVEGLDQADAGTSQGDDPENIVRAALAQQSR